MSKAEMLMEYTTQDIVAWSMDDDGIGIDEALHRFYTSTTFAKLTDVETGLYLDAPASIYAMYRDELEKGNFGQNEI